MIEVRHDGKVIGSMGPGRLGWVIMFLGGYLL